MSPPKKPGFKSTGSKPVLKSRGFLSHGTTDEKGDPVRRSTGMRKTSKAQTDTAPSTPGELNQIKPKRDYSLERK
ncbi:MAG: hypothetical protein HWE23_05240 [Rhodobacteraceae bacterium]|nr:hypothetical protein [Paracoccaceae bacterium]